MFQNLSFPCLSNLWTKIVSQIFQRVWLDSLGRIPPSKCLSIMKARKPSFQEWENSILKFILRYSLSFLNINFSIQIIALIFVNRFLDCNDMSHCLLQRLEKEYNCKCTLGKPKVAFRETIVQPFE